jgi:hypothetical protein
MNLFKNINRQMETTNANDKKYDKVPEELRPYIASAEEFISGRKATFNLIAGASKDSPDYVLSEELGERGYWFSHELNKIGISLDAFRQMAEGKFSANQTAFTMGHEIGHYRDMLDDIDAYIGNFKKNIDKAEQLAPQVLEIWRQRGAQLPANLTPAQVSGFVLEQMRDFYNALDDIYVNRLTAQSAFVFRDPKGVFSEEVSALYSEHLFPHIISENHEIKPFADYQNEPRTKQMLYYLLRKYMVPDEDVLIKSEVEEKINGYLTETEKRFGGKQIKDQIYEITRPTSEYEKKNHKPSVRYAWIEEKIEPIFLDLFWQDVKDMPLPDFKDQPSGSGGTSGESGEKGDSEGQEQSDKNGDNESEDNKDEGGQEGQPGEDGRENKEGEKGGDGSGQGEQKGEPKEENGKENQPGGDVWRPVANPRPITLEDLEKIKKSQKEKKGKEEQRKKEEAEEDKLTGREKNERQRRRAAQKAAVEAGLNKEDVDNYEKIISEIEPYRHQLAEVFSQIMENIDERLIMEWENGYKHGRFNPAHFIRRYGTAVASDQPEHIPWNELTIHEQQTFMKKLSLFPNKIKFRLIVDNSGSMEYGNKHLKARRLSVLIMEALKVFESEMNQKYRLAEEFYVDTQVITFGDPGDSSIVKPFDSENKETDKRLARWRAIKEIDARGGSTHDDEAWEKVNEDIDYEDELKSDKALELCFEITDGGSHSAKNTREQITQAINKGVKTLGFLVGAVKEDKEIFDWVWNNNDDGTRPEQLGFPIDNPEDLCRVIAERFAKEILAKQMKVQAEGGELPE